MKTIRIYFLLFLSLVVISCEEESTESTDDQQQEENLTDVSTEYDAQTLQVIEDNYTGLMFGNQNFQPINIPIEVHLVYKNDGSGQSLSGNQIQAITTRLNNLYNPISEVNFDICEIHTLNNTSINNFNVNSDSSFNFIRNNHSGSDVLNIYFVEEIVGGSYGIAGLFSGQGAGDRDSFVLMDIDYFENNTTLEHEIGHFFYLYHTHGNINCGYTQDGDYVDDTPFDTNLYGNCDGLRVDEFCNYTGSDGYNPDTRNIMSYSRNSCRDRLSTGQLLRFGQVARNYNLRGYLVNNSCGSTNDCDFEFVIGYNPGSTTLDFPYTYDATNSLNNLNGGVQPFEYRVEGIDNPNIVFPYQSSSIFTIPEEGRYALFVRDANGCIVNRSVRFVD